jgi:hypothetical protein
MLGIEFLNQPKDMKFNVAGLEFMDYQKGSLFKEMVTFFEANLKTSGPRGIEFVRENEQVEKLEALIMQHTGMNITLNAQSTTNAAIDAGYMSPHNVLNIKGIEDFFSVKDSSVGQAFNRLKNTVLKGWVDTSTGMIGGDYSKVEFNLYINNYVEEFLRVKFLDRYKVTMAEALSAIVLHECGHVFTGFMHIHRSVIDPIVATTAMRLIVDNKAYGKERVAIVKEALKVLGAAQKVDERELDKLADSDIVVYFNKAIGSRDARRTLSLGTQDRSSEIYADMYAIRMGCSKTLVAALASFPSLKAMNTMFIFYGIAATMFGIQACNPVMIALGVTNVILHTLMLLGNDLVPNSSYDTPYRRIKTILRDYVVQINNNKTMDKRDKLKMLADAKDMEKIADDSKPFLEGTAVQRVVSYIINGSDFKAQEFEHYTDELLAHSLSLYANAI